MNKVILSMALMLLIGVPSTAQATTLDIYASQGNLNDIIGADTLTNGTQAHDVYQLVSLDTTYKFTGTITAYGDISVIGVVDPSTNRPPCIQPAVLSDGSIPGTMFVINAADAKATFQNLYLCAIATNNVASGNGIAMEVKGDNVRLTVDNCVFDGWQTFAIGYNGQWDDFFITNCNFRNMVHPNQWYIGEVIRNTWPGEAYTDTMSFVGNTMLGVNGYAACPVTKWYTKYFEFNNNKVLYTFKNPFFIFNVTNAKINNNHFYGNYSGGVDQAENPWWDNLWYPDTSYGVIALQPLSPDNAGMFNPADTAAAEGLRNVEVMDNTYYWPTAVTNFWDAYNDTATNWIRTPNWMNERTIEMFADDAAYPYLVESGNVNADPGYMSTIDTDLLYGTSGNDIGFLDYFNQIRTGTAATDVWGYGMTEVSGANDWTPTWPLPESAYTLGIDDEATGSVPEEFVLYTNYPNPFNPNTSIDYALSSNEKVTLAIYNIRGELVKTLSSGIHKAGIHTAVWNGQNELGEQVSSGVYIYSLITPSRTISKRLVLLK